MDLLQQNNKKKNEKTPAQKIILNLLIISIVLCIIVAIAMAYVSLQAEKKSYSISISGQIVDLNELQLITSENGKVYIPLQALSNELGYKYYKGEFRIPGEGENKGYIDNNKNIIQFFTDSSTIYKTTETSNTDYEYYTLENSILEYNGKIYIAIDDLDVALNLIVTYSETANQTSITTPEKWLKEHEETFKKMNTVISNEPDNLKAMSYGYAIINRDNKYGVISLISGDEIIGNKYSSILFCEYTKDFIVTNTTNKYGVITKTGIAEIDLQYDNLQILNYNPLLYRVEKSGKVGILKEDGSIINEIKYDSIGFPKNEHQEIKYSLIVPSINENITESIIVCSDRKYGLIELETGKEIISCMLEGIYAKEDGNYYALMQNKKEYSLEIFIENLNKLTVSVE